MLTLETLGWNEFFSKAFKQLNAGGCAPARVVEENRGCYHILSAQGDLPAEITGNLWYNASGREELPAVGDWVGARISPDGMRALIQFVLPRRSKISRKSAGRELSEQIVVANVDTLFVTMSLDGNFNLRRVERYVTLAWEGGSQPVILLTKADLCEYPAARAQEVAAVALATPIHVLSMVTGEGMGTLEPYLRRGRTAALVGSSGVGKSTLINRLLGREALRTQAVRDYDSRGRHTTSSRQLILLPGGGMLIDTPGMRELQLWEADAGLDRSFGDIAILGQNCRFRDCTHVSEPGCAVLRALQEGTLDAERFNNYLKLGKELDFLARKRDPALQSAHEKKWRSIHQELKRINKRKQ